jgi:retron-type reverse transcriptase
VEKGLPHGKHLATGLPVLLRSHSNTLVSVERVTEINAGRKTAGVDGEVALTVQDRAGLIARATREARSWRPLPVKRVYIVRREALCCIPNTVGRNLEDRFWAQWLT